jgi:hypothetical protein
MKKYIFAFTMGSFLFLSNIQAQSGTRPKMDPQTMTDKMATDLGLNNDQKAKVLTLNTEVIKKMQAMRSSGEDKDAMHADRKKIQQDRETSLKDILTPDQFKKYQDERAAARANRAQN